MPVHTERSFICWTDLVFPPTSPPFPCSIVFFILLHPLNFLLEVSNLNREDEAKLFFFFKKREINRTANSKKLRFSLPPILNIFRKNFIDWVGHFELLFFQKKKDCFCFIPIQIADFLCDTLISRKKLGGCNDMRKTVGAAMALK